MKFWKMCLLVFISSSSFAQPIDHGYISLTRSGKNIRIPIERISCSNEDDITLRAFGRTTEPSCNTIVLSIVLHKLSTDPQDMNPAKSWLSLESKNNSGENFYISYGFRDPFSFYTSYDEPLARVNTIQTTAAQLLISNIERQNSTIVLTGNFTSSHVNNAEGNRETIEIQDGNFTLVAEENETMDTAIEEDVPPSPFDPYILPAYYFIVSPQLQSISTEEESFIDPAVPLPNQVQPSQKSPAPQQEYNRRTTRTGRSAVTTNPQRTSPYSPGRENQQPSDTTAQNQRPRTSGGRRGGR
jgi:hypothetical protein